MVTLELVCLILLAVFFKDNGPCWNSTAFVLFSIIAGVVT